VVQQGKGRQARNGLEGKEGGKREKNVIDWWTWLREYPLLSPDTPEIHK
jgi:hypothetical protein